MVVSEGHDPRVRRTHRGPSRRAYDTPRYQVTSGILRRCRRAWGVRLGIPVVERVAPSYIGNRGLIVLIGERIRGGPEALRAAGPAGIIVFERLLPQPIPRLRPYVWSRKPGERSVLPGGAKPGRLGALIVGSKGSLPRGEALRA